MGGRTVGNVLVAAGLVAMAAGALGLVVDDDEGAGAGEPALAAEATTTSTTASTSTTAAPTTTTSAPTTSTSSTTTVPVETPGEFFARWTDALNNGDAAFLVARLHPAVFERYERADCEAYLGSRPGGAAQSDVLSTGGIAPWRWETDGLAREIPETLTVRLRRTEDGGETFVENDVHVVVAGPLIQWFTDCGTPKEGAR